MGIGPFYSAQTREQFLEDAKAALGESELIALAKLARAEMAKVNGYLDRMLEDAKA